MGECNYYLKAKFETTEEAQTALRGLTRLIKAIERYTCTLYSGKKPTATKSKILKEFFKISKADSIWEKPSKQEDYLPDCNLEDEPYVVGNVLHYMSYVSHMTSWGPLCNYIEKKFNAIKVVCATEEDGSNMDSLHLYEWEEIVEALLKKKEILPLLLHIHEDLDALITLSLRQHWD